MRLATLIQMSLPGAPCIYYGDEVGMEGRADPDCRRAYPWDPVRQDSALRAFVAGLIGLRRAEPVLRRGHFRLLATEGRTVAYGMFGEEGESSGAGRTSDGGRLISRSIGHSIGRSIVVVINAGDQSTRIDFQPVSYTHLTLPTNREV